MLSNKNVIKEKKTTPPKAPRKGKEERTTPLKASNVGKRKQTRKSNEDKIITQNQSGKRLARPLPILHKKKLKSQRKKLERL